jgi:hypothetical protein
MYINNSEFCAQLIISKARGKLTKPALEMIQLIAKNASKKLKYYNNDDRLDCYQTGILDMLTNWYSFNEEKTTNAFAYFTDIFKRGSVKSLDQINKRKGDKNRTVVVLSLNSANDGEGIHNI